MKTTHIYNHRRRRVLSLQVTLLTSLLTAVLSAFSIAQDRPLSTPAPSPVSVLQQPTSPISAVNSQVPTSASRAQSTETPPQLIPPQLDFPGLFSMETDGTVQTRQGVSISAYGITISADNLDGNIYREIVFSGHARIIRTSTTTYADAIHFFPNDGRFRLDNPRGILNPDVLQGRIYDPLFISGGEAYGNRAGYTQAQSIIATTCIEPHHHYEFRVSHAELIPNKRIVLHRVSLFMFGIKIITLPYVIIPLDRKPGERKARTDYLPEFGQNTTEGYFARFPYAFTESAAAATFLRLDVTQKLGLGYDIQQEYLAGKQKSAFDTSNVGYGGTVGLTPGANGTYVSAYGYGPNTPGLPRLGTGVSPNNGGLFTMQGYFNDGFNRNFNASYNHQQDLGGSNRVSFNTQIQKNSYFVLSGPSSNSTAQTSKFDFAHNDPIHGVALDLALGLATSNSNGFTSSQLTGDLKQNYIFASSGSTRNSLALDLNLSHLITTTAATAAAPGTIMRTALLDSQFELQHIAREYSLTFDANRTTPVGFQSSSSFGTLEKLPELMVSTDTFNYKGGLLRYLPATFQLGVGEYSEPSSKVTTDRVLLGLNLQPITIIRGSTEITDGGGFEQHLYGDGAAQYILRDTARLREHLFGRSGFDITYQYAQPEGATPFQFDALQKTHSVTAQAGYLDDKNFQLTLQTGYDLLGTSVATPWQTFTTRMMWRPTPSVRTDTTATYDPNAGKFQSITNNLQLRAKNGFGFDLVSRIDPSQPGIRRKFTQLNTQFNIPIGRHWRTTGLFRFNGLSGVLESRNAQLIHDWDCMEASFTYTETVGGFRPDRQFYLAIRIKAFPFFRAFNRGPAGEAIGTGVGNIY